MSDLILTPIPRQLEFNRGECHPQSRRLLVLSGPQPGEMLRLGRMMLAELALIGAHWHLSALPGPDHPAAAGLLAIDPSAMPHPQGYRLTLADSGRIELVAHDHAGLFYAIQTLSQIVRQVRGQRSLPQLQIEDWPDFPNRGVMLDISRDKVPTIETLELLIARLAHLKINQLQLYMEHTFAYQNHPQVWKDASPLTHEDILHLDDFCRRRYIELVPNQNSFGHMERWLKHKLYAPLSETPDDPACLCPLDPGSLELLDGLYSELLPHFASGQFNVGCDETFALGTGRSAAACESLGKGRVYLDFLLAIHKLVGRHGRRMQFWGDIILQHPELIPELPKDVIAMEWGYEAGHPFKDDTARFAGAGLDFYVCPGTSTWNAIAGRTDNMLVNLAAAARHGLAAGAKGYVVTDWGDNGHWQHLSASLPGFTRAAALSWCEVANRDADLAAALDTHVLEDPAHVLGRALLELGRTSETTGVTIPNRSILWQILFETWNTDEKPQTQALTDSKLEAAESQIGHAVGILGKAKANCIDAAQIVDEIQFHARLLKHACFLGRQRIKHDTHNPLKFGRDERIWLTENLDQLMKEHRRLWLMRNQAGGLGDSLARMQKLRDRYGRI